MANFVITISTTKMKKGFVFLAIMMAAAFIAGAQAKDWAQFNRYEEANKLVKTPTRAVFMGNSITEGWWTADSAFFKENGYIGRGISGQTSSEMLARFRPDVIALKPKVAVILAGTNDIAQNNGYISLEHVMDNIASMVELARYNGIRVVLCSALPSIDFWWRKGLEPAEKIIALNGLIRNYAEKNDIPYADYHSLLKDENNGLPEKYSSDGVHPNIEAYKVMESIIKPLVEKEIAAH